MSVQTDRFSAQFRVEFFNLVNRTDFAGADPAAASGGR